jgi:hypothetical protein
MAKVVPLPVVHVLRAVARPVVHKVAKAVVKTVAATTATSCLATLTR